MDTTIKLLSREPFKHHYITTGNLPSNYIDSMSYYEQLAFLTDYIVNTLIAKVNENSNAINVLNLSFKELEEYVKEQVGKIPELEQAFIDFTTKIEGDMDKLTRDLTNLVNEEISSLRIQLYKYVEDEVGIVENELTTEVARLDEKIETFPLVSTQVFNSVRGIYTDLQTYLDDLSNINRENAITAEDYDELELTATEYDSKDISAQQYDINGRVVLIGGGGGGGGLAPLVNITTNNGYSIFPNTWQEGGSITKSGMVTLEQSSDGTQFRFSGYLQLAGVRDNTRTFARTRLSENEDYYGIDTGLVLATTPSSVKIIRNVCLNNTTTMGTSGNVTISQMANQENIAIAPNGHIFVMVTSDEYGMGSDYTNYGTEEKRTYLSNIISIA